MKALQVKFTAMCLLWGASFVQAQRFTPSRWEFGAGVGVYLYQGDLTPSVIGGYKDPKPGLHLFVSRVFTNNLSVRGQFALSALKTNESDYSKPEWRQQRNLAFVTPLSEFSVLAVWNIKGDLMDEPQVKTFSPYVFAGGALTVLRVVRDFTRFNGDYFNTQPRVLAGWAADAVRPTPRVTPVIPVGAGTKYAISNKFSVYGEAAYRLGFSDYIDGVSQAGNPRKKDHYYSVTIGLTYRPFRGFGSRGRGIGCPVVQ